MGLYLVAKDLSIHLLNNNELEVVAGNKKYHLSGENLEEIFLNQISKLDGTRSIQEIFEKDTLKIFKPMIPQLVEMGIILPIDREISIHLTDETDRFRYTYFYRNTKNPKDLFLNSKNKTVAFYSDITHLNNQIVERLKILRNFKYEFISDVNSVNKADYEVIFPIVFKDELYKLQKIQDICFEKDIKLCPLTIDMKYKVEIGPWVYPYETSCLYCFNETIFEQDRQEKEPALFMDTTDIDFILVTMNIFYNQTFKGYGENTPWGKKITIDIKTGEQKVTQLLKDPFCTKCNKRLGEVESWEVI